MIHILDRQTEQVLDVLVNHTDSKIYWDTKMTEALEDSQLIFEFTTVADGPASKYIVPKNKITAQDQDGFHRIFSIETVEKVHDENGKLLIVTALGDHTELGTEQPIAPQTLEGQTAETAVQFVLAGTRYVPGQIDFAGSRTITFDSYISPLAALNQIASTFELELRFRVEVHNDGTITRVVDLLKPDDIFDGKEIVFGKDLLGIHRKENTDNICTRLIGVGPADENGNLVTFASVNGGKIYVEDDDAFQRWNNAGRHVWGIFEYQPESNTDVTPQELLDATKKELQNRINSAVEWEVSAAALEQIPGLEHERVRVGMNIRIKDEAFDPAIYLEARVLETEMPELDDPNGNFSYTFGNYREVKVIVPAEVKAIQKILFHNSGGWSAAKVKADIAQQIANEAKADVEAANARIDNLVAIDITALHAEIENLEAIKANVEDLFSINAEIENLRVGKADIEDLNATNARIDNLEATKADIDDLDATNARIDNLEATKANITDLDAMNAAIQNLQADKANITDLNATNARIDNLVTNDLTAINAAITNLQAEKADITDLNAVNATIATLQADVGSINTLLAGNLGAENFQAGAIYAGSGVIAKGAIGDAEISNLNASKINAGILNTALVTIQGANGRLKMSGNRLQVFANKSDGSLYERVSLGDVNGDGSVYGLRVRGSDGKTVLLDENGVKSEGITDGSITNDKIADDANISGTKLDIASVVTEINEGTTTIQSSKIFYNGKTLDIQLGTMQTTINNQGQTITNHETRITATEQGLATKVSVSQYQQDQAALSSQLSQMSTQIQQQANQIALKADASNVYTKSQIDGQFTAVNTQISNLSAQLTLQADQIATKVSKTEFDALQIGGRNLAGNTDYQKQPETYNSQVQIINGNPNSVLVTRSSNQGWGVVSDRITTFVSGQVYTLSFELKTSDVTKLTYIYIMDNDEGNVSLPISINITADGQWHKYIVTFTSPATRSNAGIMIAADFRVISGNQFELRKLKLELGNKATDWTPAPEDVQGQIDGLGSRMTTAETSITQLSNQIALKANQSTVDTLTGQVSSLQAQLTVQADQIATKVEKDGVISAINQTAESIKIQASKVDLSGYVTFTNLSTPGQTTIDGGNLKTGSVTTDKIAAKAITADKLNVTSLSAISADLGNVTAGTIRGVNIYGSTIEGTVLKSSDTPSWDDPNYTTKASIQSGWLQFWDKSLGAELKLDVSGLGMTLNGSAGVWNFVPHDYRPNSSTYTTFRNGSIGVADRNGDTKFFITTDRFGIGGPGNVSFEVIAGPFSSDAEVKIGRYTLKSEFSGDYLTLSGGLLRADIVGALYAPASNTYIANDGEARVVWGRGYNDGNFQYRPIRASSFPTGSLAEYKEDIHPWQESALEKIRSATIYEYHLKSELEQGIYRKRQGLVIGEGYNTPDGVIDGDGVEQYLMNAWSWKAIQELDSEQQALKDRVAWLELENQYLKQKIQQLEAMVS